MPTGLTLVNVPDLADALATATAGVPVHGALATGTPLVTNGHLGADLIHVQAGDQFPVHTHPGHHLLYCLRGEGTITVDQHTHPVRAGDLYMVEGAVPHAVGAVTDHTLMAIGAPHKPVQATDRMTPVDWAGNPISSAG